MNDYDDGYNDGYGLAQKDAAAEITALRKELAKYRSALQKIADLPVVDHPGIHLRKHWQQIAIAALTDEEGAGK